MNTNDKSGWISVEDRLPEYDELVMWVKENGSIFIDEIDHDNTFENFRSWYEEDPISLEKIKITHWMYLPQPPQTKNS